MNHQTRDYPETPRRTMEKRMRTWTRQKPDQLDYQEEALHRQCVRTPRHRLVKQMKETMKKTMEAIPQWRAHRRPECPRQRMWRARQHQHRRQHEENRSHLMSVAPRCASDRSEDRTSER